MYCAIFAFPRDMFDITTVKSALTGLRLKDKSIKYSIDLIDLIKDKYVVKIYCKDLNELHKKALWIRDKIFNNEVGYKVKEVKEVID